MDIKKIILTGLIYLAQASLSAQISHPPFRYVGEDSVVTHASNRYSAMSFLRKVFMGRNYRREWAEPVTLPVFRLSNTRFTIEELGGGMQTKSLKLKDSSGKIWALRTIDKDVEGAMPPLLKNTFAQKLSQDQISATMPYGTLIIGDLARSAGITAAQPAIYFVADDTAFGSYQSIFANTVCMLEERDPGFSSTEDTKTVLRSVQHTNTHVVDQKVLLRARLFDMLLADWDRHYDNWRWGTRDSAGIKFYHAVPRDRDWAFYYSGGLVPKLVRLAVLRFLINFKEEPEHIKSLSYKAHTFDAVFLNGMNLNDWREAVRHLQQSLTDAAIEQAVKKLPPAIYALQGNSFIQRLKARRDRLEEGVVKYYHFLSRQVQIDGSNEADVFSFKAADNGFVLQIFRLEKETATRQILYERRFLQSETHSVVINGLGSDDLFEFDEAISTTIQVKINGGTGADRFILQGNIRISVQEEGQEANSIINKNGTSVSFY